MKTFVTFAIEGDQVTISNEHLRFEIVASKERMLEAIDDGTFSALRELASDKIAFDEQMKKLRAACMESEDGADVRDTEL